MTDFQLGPGPLTPEFEQLKSDIGIVENGNTATHSIPSGYYVIWNGDLYIAKTDISTGTTLSAESNGNLTAKTQGLGAEVSTLKGKTTVEAVSTEIQNVYLQKMGNVAIVFFIDKSIPSYSSGGSWQTLFTLPSGCRPVSPTEFIAGICVSTGSEVLEGRVNTNGNVNVYVYAGMSGKPVCGQAMFFI